jgi:hypothetical protein
MFTQEVNVDAMYRATTLLFGDQAAMILAKVADTIDRAQQDAYAAGLAAGQENLEAACDASFDAGWQFGEAEGRLEAEGDIEAEIAASGDEGYIEGVRDARANPAFADEVVQEILTNLAAEHYEALDEYDADNVQDSGDENDGLALDLDRMFDRH